MSDFWKYFKVLLLGIAIGITAGGIIAICCKASGKYEINTTFRGTIGRHQVLSVDKPVELRLEYCGQTNFVFRDQENHLIMGDRMSDSQLPLSLEGPCWEKRIAKFTGDLILVQSESGASILLSATSINDPVTLRIYYPQDALMGIFRLWAMIFGTISAIVGLLIVKYG